jgi:hypothetical protein
MRQVLFKILIVVVAAIMVSGVGVSAPATERRNADSPSASANSKLFLTIRAGETAKAIPEAAVTLTCDPDNGSHPHATEACNRLREVDGDFTKLDRDTDIMCPALWAPITVTAHGTWQGHPIDWQRTYSNACELRASTYPIFAF